VCYVWCVVLLRTVACCGCGAAHLSVSRNCPVRVCVCVYVCVCLEFVVAGAVTVGYSHEPCEARSLPRCYARRPSRFHATIAVDNVDKTHCLAHTHTHTHTHTPYSDRRSQAHTPPPFRPCAGCGIARADCSGIQSRTSPRPLPACLRLRRCGCSISLRRCLLTTSIRININMRVNINMWVNISSSSIGHPSLRAGHMFSISLSASHPNPSPNPNCISVVGDATSHRQSRRGVVAAQTTPACRVPAPNPPGWLVRCHRLQERGHWCCPRTPSHSTCPHVVSRRLHVVEQCPIHPAEFDAARSRDWLPWQVERRWWCWCWCW